MVSRPMLSKRFAAGPTPQSFFTGRSEMKPNTRGLNDGQAIGLIVVACELGNELVRTYADDATSPSSERTRSRIVRLPWMRNESLRVGR